MSGKLGIGASFVGERALPYGQRSDVISEEDARALVQTLPRARFIDLKGAGHMIAGDANDAFAASVAAFLHEVMPSTQSPSGEI